MSWLLFRLEEDDEDEDGNNKQASFVVFPGFSKFTMYTDGEWYLNDYTPDYFLGRHDWFIGEFTDWASLLKKARSITKQVWK